MIKPKGTVTLFGPLTYSLGMKRNKYLAKYFQNGDKTERCHSLWIQQGGRAPAHSRRRSWPCVCCQFSLGPPDTRPGYLHPATRAWPASWPASSWSLPDGKFIIQICPFTFLSGTKTQTLAPTGKWNMTWLKRLNYAWDKQCAKP